MATLVAPKDGRPCVYVKGLAKGVRVAGLMLQAEQRISCSRTMSNIHPKQDIVIVEVSAHVSHIFPGQAAASKSTLKVVYLGSGTPITPIAPIAPISAKAIEQLAGMG